MKKETVDVWMFVTRDIADNICRLKEENELLAVPDTHIYKESKEKAFYYLSKTDRYLVDKMQEKLNLEAPCFLWHGYCLYHGKEKCPSLDIMTGVPDESVCVHLKVPKESVIFVDANRYYSCIEKRHYELEKMDLEKELMTLNHFEYPKKCTDALPFEYTWYDDVFAFFPLITEKMVVSVDYRFMPRPDEYDQSLVFEIAKGYAQIKAQEDELEEMKKRAESFHGKYIGIGNPNPVFPDGCLGRDGESNREMALSVAKACLADKKYSCNIKDGCGNPWKVSHIYLYYTIINKGGSYPYIPEGAFNSPEIKKLLEKENRKLEKELKEHDKAFMEKLSFEGDLGRRKSLMTTPRFKNRLF